MSERGTRLWKDPSEPDYEEKPNYIECSECGSKITLGDVYIAFGGRNYCKKCGFDLLEEFYGYKVDMDDCAEDAERREEESKFTYEE